MPVLTVLPLGLEHRLKMCHCLGEEYVTYYARLIYKGPAFYRILDYVVWIIYFGCSLMSLKCVK